jgi:diguanylate cyclase (GGDEF)-like protein/PAS domain S-box-containing protein
MERLKQVIPLGEDDIVRRMFERACAQGYGQRMPALEESYRIEVGMLSANLVQTIELEGEVRGIAASTDMRDDPVAALGARFARVRGAETSDTALLLGLLKCYRETYRDFVTSAGLRRDEARQAVRAIARFFDRVEIGVVQERMAGGMTGRSPREGGDRHGVLVEERNRYLAAFSSLPLPALFIDHDGHVEHINAAASLLFGPPGATRSRYFRDPADREPSPVLAREIDEFRDDSDVEKSFERELDTGKGTRYFQVRFTKTFAADASFSGVLVVLNDLTYRRNAEEALRQSQTQYAALFEHMPIGFVHTRVLLDRRNRAADHTVLEVNPAFEHLSGASAAVLVGRPFTEALRSAGAQGPEWMDVLGRTALTGETASFEARLGSKGLWTSVSAFSPAPGHVALMLLDITDVKAVEESLARSRDSYLTLLEGLPALVWRAGPDGRIDFVNDSWIEFTGAPAVSDSPDRMWEEAVHPDDRGRWRAVLSAAARGHSPLEIEYRLRSAGDGFRWVKDTARPFEGLDGSFAGLIGTTVDVGERHERAQTADGATTSDALTGLPNSGLFRESLARAIAQAQRGGRSVLLLVDVDRFRELTESRARDIGDMALRRIADAARTLVRSGDLIARVGADEFAVLLQTADSEAGEGAARRLVGAVRALCDPDIGPLTVSVGVSEVSGDADADIALGYARRAVEAAQKAGGDRLAVDEPSHAGARVCEVGGVAFRVAAALASGDGLMLSYQPAFRVADGEVEFSEALVRLRDARGALLEPAEFLEDTAHAGLMPRLTRWVVKQAIADLRDTAGASVSVNLSADAMTDTDMLTEAAGWADEAGVPAGSLSFEVSEDDALARMSDARRFMVAARQLGFGIGLDHVAHTRHSFAHLQELPVDRVTIDGGVISSLLGDPRRARSVESLQTVAAAMGIRTVAQWVEDERTLAMVSDAGVDMVQGRHVAAPAETLILHAEGEWAARFPQDRAAGPA